MVMLQLHLQYIYLPWDHLLTSDYITTEIRVCVLYVRFNTKLSKCGVCLFKMCLCLSALLVIDKAIQVSRKCHLFTSTRIWQQFFVIPALEVLGYWKGRNARSMTYVGCKLKQ